MIRQIQNRIPIGYGVIIDAKHILLRQGINCVSGYPSGEALRALRAFIAQAQRILSHRLGIPHGVGKLAARHAGR